jgi:hypothetical protein
MGFKQRFLNAVHWLYFALLVWGTVLILLRRWCWNQVPTQVSAPVVYLTLIINACWIALLIFRWWRPPAT